MNCSETLSDGPFLPTAGEQWEDQLILSEFSKVEDNSLIVLKAQITG